MIINDEMQEAEYSEERTSSRSHKQMNNKRFRKEYMTIPKFSKWLQGVTSDEKRFYCIFCEKTFLGGKWEINKHHNSTKHQNKSEKFETIHTNKPDEESNVLFVQSNNHKRFKDEYVELPGCHAWLQKVADDPRKFFCKHCQKEMLGGLLIPYFC